jgi:hypothetical protein
VVHTVDLQTIRSLENADQTRMEQVVPCGLPPGSYGPRHTLPGILQDCHDGFCHVRRVDANIWLRRSHPGRKAEYDEVGRSPGRIRRFDQKTDLRGCVFLIGFPDATLERRRILVAFNGNFDFIRPVWEGD